MTIPVCHPRPNAWEPTPVSQLPSWADARRVCVDIETRDPNIKKLGPGVRRGDGYVVGVGFAIDGGPAHYLPIRHEGEGNLDEETVWRYLRDQARVMRASDEIVGANFMYDADWLTNHDVTYDCWIRDVQVAEPLIDEYQYSYSLDNILKRYQLPGKDQDTLRWEAKARGLHEKGELWKMPAAACADYVIGDVRKPLALLRRQERTIEAEGLQEAWDLESRVLPVALRMRQRGVRMDEGRLERLEDWALAEEEGALAEIHRLTGVTIGDCMKAEEGYRSLEGVERRYTDPSSRHPQGQLSLAADYLEELAKVEPVAKSLLWARQVWKTRTMYCATFRTHMVRGRIHPTFNQCKIQKEDGSTKGAVSRRGSMDSPNFQQLTNPEKHPVTGRKIRELVLPEEGAVWFAGDFSRQEPCWAVHFGVRGGFPGAREVARKWHDDPDLDCYVLIATQIHKEFPKWWKEKDPRAKKWRKIAKDTFLAQLYGQGGGSLCRKLGYPVDPVPRSFVNASGDTITYTAPGPEGQGVIDAVNEALPFARAMARDIQDKAKRRGWIMLPDGGRRRYSEDPGSRYHRPYKAPNGLIQGSAAIQTKVAMIELDRAGHFLQLMVHDEADGSCGGPEEATKIKEIMETCYNLEVPMRVDIELGPSWGECH